MIPTVSVLMPVRNGSGFVRTAIASALAQTCRDIEVIAVDDGSTDDTWDVLCACAREDPRVVPRRRIESAGPAAARNLGLGHVRGRWIALLDADDAFLPDRLARMIARAEQLGADLLADNLILQDFATGAPLGRAFPDAGMRLAAPLTLLDILARDSTAIPIHSRFGFVKPIIRGEFLRTTCIRYQEDIRAGSDFLFYCACVLAGGKFHLDPEAGYVFSVRQGSVSNRPDLTRYHSIANQRLLGMVPPTESAVHNALLRRQTMIDFDCFRVSLRALKLDLAMSLGLVRGLPLVYLLRRIGLSALRRIGAPLRDNADRLRYRVRRAR
jgi:glycosyltransferase involved in cell wall biosynthesis